MYVNYLTGQGVPVAVRLRRLRQPGSASLWRQRQKTLLKPPGVLTRYLALTGGECQPAPVLNSLIACYGRREMKFRPLHDRVVVKRLESDQKTKGGIIIPDTAKEKPQEGEVIAVGPGARDDSGKIIALDVKAGDRILFGKWSGTEVKIDGEELLVMKESDIMGIIEK